jgi:hypothetical protein
MHKSIVYAQAESMKSQKGVLASIRSKGYEHVKLLKSLICDERYYLLGVRVSSFRNLWIPHPSLS